MEIFASHIGEGVDLCYQKTFVSRIPEKYRQVTTERCSAMHESRNYWRKTKMEERGEGSKGNQGGIDDENDDDIDGRIEEEKMQRSCRSLDVLEIAPSVVARRSTRWVNRRGAFFFSGK